MEVGKNIFKLDGPINGKSFLKSALIILAYVLFGTLVLTLLHLSFELTRYNIWFFIILWAALVIVMLYTAWVNFTKRLWDIIGDKANAIFYSIAWYIASIAINFIPFIKYLGVLLSILALCVLLFWKGKLVKTKAKKKDDIA